ncbi:MAG: hypothetical protein M1821_004975 [Bathelium mastoideum]|nr:MAG: hypothetical protein M1821_004975 [Bathelium mastoideum]
MTPSPSTAKSPLPSKIPRLKHKSSSASDVAAPTNTTTDADPPYPSLLEPSLPTASLLPPPSFRPFFTLVEDAASGAHHHPAVHYLFADDEPDTLTDACLRALEPASRQHLRSSGRDEGGEQQQGGREQRNDEEGGREERILLVDMSADARTVVAARSLSPQWQVVGVRVEAAPTWEDAGGGGMMLRIEGMEAEEKDGEVGNEKTKGQGRREGWEKTAMKMLEEARRAANNGDVFQGMGELVKRVGKGVEILEKVVGPEEEEDGEAEGDEER